MSVAIERIAPQPGRRIVAISDVHGSLSLLKALLHKVELKPDDLLILVAISPKRAKTAWKRCVL